MPSYAEPHLRSLRADPRALVTTIGSAASYSASSGLAHAVLLPRRTDAALLRGGRLSGLPERTDATAAAERGVGALLEGSLAR